MTFKPNNAATKIQKCWRSYRDRRLFLLLKHTVCAAAAVDACKIMGHRRFYDQIICDEIQRQKKKIVDEVDVVSMKDYMQYTSNLDETPAYLGGKGNTWRKLSLEEMPRSTVMYDIVDYAKSGCLSESLREKLPLLLMKPTSEEMQLQQLRTISQPRYYKNIFFYACVKI
ncbi:CX058 protein, partial [Polypterus senegalus]